jgi:hypothetical protein
VLAGAGGGWWNEWKVGGWPLFILGTWITAILVSQPFRGSDPAQLLGRDDEKSRRIFRHFLSPRSA